LSWRHLASWMEQHWHKPCGRAVPDSPIRAMEGIISEHGVSRFVSKKPRPVGVTIVGVLYLLAAIITFFAALSLTLLSFLTQADFIEQLPDAPQWLVQSGSFVLLALGLIIFLVAVVNLVVAVGCFRGWGWVWTWGMLFAILDIFFSIFNAYGQGFSFNAMITGLVGAIIPLLIIIYLNTRKVKEFFGKA